MSMMCAVISDPFWAGLLKQITAHTPALAFQNNNLHKQFNPQITQMPYKSA